jgi:hypothetical protein
MTTHHPERLFSQFVLFGVSYSSTCPAWASTSLSGKGEAPTRAVQEAGRKDWRVLATFESAEA